MDGVAIRAIRGVKCEPGIGWRQAVLVLKIHGHEHDLGKQHETGAGTEQTDCGKLTLGKQTERQ